MSATLLNRQAPRGFGESYGSRPQPVTEIKIPPLGVDVVFSRLFRLLRRDWDTGAGLAARRLCWALYNQQSPPVPLWSAVAELSQAELEEYARLLVLPPDRREQRLTELLAKTGEMERIDHEPLYTWRQEVKNGAGQVAVVTESQWPAPGEKGGPEA